MTICRIQRKVVYSILNSGRYGHFFQYIVIAGQKRITKESFHAFLCGQDKYKLALEHGDGENISACAEHREKDEEDLANTQGLDQNCEKEKNSRYITAAEAAERANVTIPMVIYWCQKEYFPVTKVGRHIRIKREEFEIWLEQRPEGGVDHGINQEAEW